MVTGSKDASSHFHMSKPDFELDELTHRKFADNMEKKIKWVIGIYCQWREHSLTSSECDPRIHRSDLCYPKHLVMCNIAFCLCKFLTEVRKINSDKYPPHALYQMVVSIQMYLESHKIYWRLLGKGHDDLNDLYYTLDNLMKQYTAQGMGKKTSAKVVSKMDEDKMWDEGVLGDDHPKQLCDTVLFLLGMNLALHGGEEHRRLQWPGFNP